MFKRNHRYSQQPKSPHLHRVTQQTVPDWIYEQKVSGVMLRTPTAMKSPLASLYDRKEKEKKRIYNHRVMSVQQGTFTPLVFTTTGSAAPECAAFLKKLSIKTAEKRKERLSDVTTWVRCKISFMCFRAVLMCLRGTRKSTMSYISQDFSVDTIDSRIS